MGTFDEDEHWALSWLDNQPLNDGERADVRELTAKFKRIRHEQDLEWRTWIYKIFGRQITDGTSPHASLTELKAWLDKQREGHCSAQHIEHVNGGTYTWDCRLPKGEHRYHKDSRGCSWRDEHLDAAWSIDDPEWERALHIVFTGNTRPSGIRTTCPSCGSNPDVDCICRAR